MPAASSPARCCQTARPALWRDIPRMLFDRDSAVRVRWSYLPQIAPWLIRFLLAGRHARVQAIADALQPLVSRAYDAHRELIALSGADDIVRPVGWLKVYETERGFAGTQYDRDDHAGARREARRTWPGRDPSARAEPGATLCEGAVPAGQRLRRLAIQTGAGARGAFPNLGGSSRRSAFAACSLRTGACAWIASSGIRNFDAVVIAAGAWSKELARQVGDRVPLDTERGYHLNLEPGAGRRTAPPRGVSRTRLRAGAYAGRHPPDQRRRTGGPECSAGFLAHPPPSAGGPRGAAGLSDRVTRQWLGYRPSTPEFIAGHRPYRRTARRCSMPSAISISG